MSTTSTGASTETPEVGTIDMKLEVVTLPVSDVDRAKRFYQSLGWRMDIDVVVSDDFRQVQMTPPRSQCSIHFGKGLTTMEPGSLDRLYLAVQDIDAAGKISSAAVSMSARWRSSRSPPGSTCPAAPISRTRRSATPTATRGCSKK